MEMLVAHMFGDYFFQNEYIALNKTKNTLVCLLHCAIYTTCVAIICQWFDYRLIIVFLSHFIMDRFRLAKYWTRLISKNEDLPWVILSDNSVHLLVLLLLK